jgi:hypothetical protein
MPGNAQSTSEDTLHAPRRGSQQVPCGCGHGLGSQEVPAASQVPLSAPVPVGGGTQSTSCDTVQVPSGWQQTPVGAAAGHANVSQVNVSCHTCVGATQAARVVTAQVPSRTLQQANSGCGHGLSGRQVSQSSCQILGEAQLTSIVTVQVPDETQQAPVGGCGHGFGVQVSQSSCHVAGEMQPACVVTVQSPARTPASSGGTQQAPVGGCGHGFGLHTAPEVQTPGGVRVAQAPWSVTKQAPVGTQQAPPTGQGFGSQAMPWPR